MSEDITLQVMFTVLKDKYDSVVQENGSLKHSNQLRLGVIRQLQGQIITFKRQFEDMKLLAEASVVKTTAALDQRDAAMSEVAKMKKGC